MEKNQIDDELNRFLNNELDDCELALKAEGLERASRELDDAVTEIRRIERDILID